MCSSNNLQEEPIFDGTRFSTFSRLRRVLAWVRRFVNNKFGLDVQSGELSVEELKKIDILLSIIVQQESYDTKIAALRQGEKIKSYI